MIAQPALASAAVPVRRVPVGTRAGGLGLAALGLVLVMALGAAWMALGGPGQPAAVPLAAPAPVAAGPVMVPDHTTDGLIAFTIPLGAAEDQADGGTPYVMPATIRMKVGDKVVVTNDDTYPHIILSSLAMPGATTTMVFDEPGIHAFSSAFSSGCTANGGTINAFTSVIVSERS